MSTETRTSLRLTRIIKADIHTVFEAWTQPRHLRRWSCPEGATVDDVAVDLSIEGSYRIVMNTGKAVHTAYGRYREIDNPNRLVYTWAWENGEMEAGESLVTVEFNDLGISTEVVLTHELFPTEEATKAHEEGWTSCLNQLEGMFA
jgi:glutathione S-transferase